MRKISVIISVLALLSAAPALWADEIDATTHLKYTVSSGEVTVTGFDPDFTPPADYALVIPDEIADMPVVAVGNAAFLDVTTFTSLTIGKNVRTLGTDAFRRATSMTSVSFAVDGALTTIGESAFRGCAGLTEFVMPNTVTSVGTYSFQANANLASITLSDHLVTIGVQAFCNIPLLTSIEIPSSVKTISNGAFRDCIGLTAITVPNGPTTFGTNIFSNCPAIETATFDCANIPANVISYNTGLQTVVIGPDVKTIGTAAFRGCTALTTVTFEAGCTLTTIGEQVFMDCTGLGSITIPRTVTFIGRISFQSCTSLTALTFEDGSALATIDEGAFNTCTALTSVTIPAGVTAMGNNTFGACSALASVVFADGNAITAIPTNCFNHCSSLSSITLPSTVNSIGNAAFAYCNVFSSFTVPSGVTVINNNAFDNCTGLTSISLPSGITSIGYQSFRNCYRLTSFTIPSSVVSIGEYAFAWCSGLLGIEIPSAVKTIGNYAFRECTSLATLTFAAGSKLTGIGTGVFQNCSSLGSISFPSGTKSIGGSTFIGCTSLVSVSIPASVNDMGTHVFNGSSALETVTIAEPSALTVIPTGTFIDCTSLSSFTIPSSITTINIYAFQGCTALGSITIPGTVKTVAGAAFQNCTSLASLTVQNGVEEIANDVFTNCAFTNVVIPSSVSVLGNDLFAGCSNLATLDLSRAEKVTTLYGLASINRSATGIFKGIPAACEVILPPYCMATGDHVTITPPGENPLTQAADGYYELSTAEHWRLFSYIALGKNGWANARMTADINLGDDQSRIGTPANANSGWYRGIFDGQGHTLTVAYVETGENNLCAPFNKINGATIRNLKVTGTINLTFYGYHPAGIVSASWGTSTLENLWSDITISGIGADWREAGAIVGCHKNGALTLNDCLFTGHIGGSGGWNGCFIGYCDQVAATQNNCLSTGTFTYEGTSSNFRGTHVNCYVKSFPKSLVDGITLATDENLADGTVAAALQAGRSEVVWVQDPVLNTPMLVAFASPLPPVEVTASPATIWGDDVYVSTFYSGTTSYALPADAYAYTAELDGESVVFYRIGVEGNVIPAGTAAIIVSKSSSVELSGLYSTAVTAKDGNILEGSDTDVTVSAGKVDSKIPYVLGVSGGTLGLYRFSGDSIPAGKAYYLKNE